ncbi:MAG: lysophospholipid acyltransferase family protein [Sulfurovum sp.]|nr:lysophospholipid acyltransferase family protein [Sulfurovum sp.]
MREKIEYAFIKLFLYFSKILPKSLMYSFIKNLTMLVYHLDKKRSRLTKDNLSKAYPEKSREEIKTLSKEVYVELSKTICEILLMAVDRFDIDDAIVNLEESKEKLNDLVAHSPSGIVVLTAHFSNWELAAHVLAKHGLPMLAVGRKGNNTYIDEKITLPFRAKYGNEPVSKKQAMLAMAKRLKKAQAVGLLLDQKSGHLGSAKVDFFAMPAETTLSVASLKLKLNPMIVPIFIARQEDGKYKMIIEKPIEYSAEELKEKEEKLTAMTQKYTLAIENVIRQYPTQWFWMHNRWRR